jgi:hypothetical protein
MVLTGSCPWPGSWSGSHGAHLHLQAREDPIPTVCLVPSTLSASLFFTLPLREGRKMRKHFSGRGPAPAAELLPLPEIYVAPVRCRYRPPQIVDPPSSAHDRHRWRLSRSCLAFPKDSISVIQLSRVATSDFRTSTTESMNHSLDPMEVAPRRRPVSPASSKYAKYSWSGLYWSAGMPKRDSVKRRTQPQRDNSLEAVAKRLGADEDEARFEAKLGKIAKAKPWGKK